MSAYGGIRVLVSPFVPPGVVVAISEPPRCYKEHALRAPVRPGETDEQKFARILAEGGYVAMATNVAEGV